jgi:hypothetical protein
MDIWFASVNIAMAGLDSGAVNRKGAVEPAEGLGASLDGSDGAENDEAVSIEADASVTVLKEAFAWGENTAIAVPDFVEEWWYDAVMHVAGDDEIEMVEGSLNAVVCQMDGRVNEGDFEFVFREFGEFVGESVEFIDKNVYIFVAIVFVVLIVFGRESETIDIKIAVFVSGVVEQMDIFDRIDEIEEGGTIVGNIAIGLAEGRAEIFTLAVKVVVADADCDWGDFAEAFEPGSEAFLFASFIYAAERVDEITGNGNEVRRDGFDLFGDEIEIG